MKVEWKVFFTNCLLWTIAATCLFEAGIDEQFGLGILVQQVCDHTSVPILH